MKFTKEDACKELVKRMTEKGEKLNLSERTLKHHLETLMKYAANDETELSAFVDSVFSDVKELDGQYRKDNSDFIKKWNEEHPSQNPNDVKKVEKVEEESEAMKQLLDKMSKLEDRIAKEDKAKVISTKRNELALAMEKKGIKDKSWRDDFLAEINITEDIDIESKAESFLKIYNKTKASDETNYTPLSSEGGSKNVSKLFDDIQKDYEREHKKEEN